MDSGSISKANEESGSTCPEANDLDNGNKCIQCGSTFKHASSLSRHKKTHATTNNSNSNASSCQPHTCHICLQSFQRKDNLLKHKKLVKCKPPAIKQTEWICPICSKTFGKKSNLDRHVKLHDKENNNLICSVDGCGRVYKRPDKFAAHVKSHSITGKVAVPIPVRLKANFRKRLFEMDNAADIALATGDNFETPGEYLDDDADNSFSLSMAVDSTSSTTVLWDVSSENDSSILEPSRNGSL